MTLNNYDGGEISFTSASEFNANIVLAGKNTITMDGEVGLFADSLTLSGEGELDIIGDGRFMCVAGPDEWLDSIVIKSGTYMFSNCEELAAGEIVIDGGVLTGEFEGLLGGDITINGGEIIIQDGHIETDTWEEEGLEGDITINGGKISIVNEGALYPVVWAEGRININGGQLSVNTPLYGIYSNAGITFNGGITKVIITDDDNPEAVAIVSGEAITLGPKVFIVEEGISFKEATIDAGTTFYASLNADGTLAKKVTIQEIPEETPAEDEDSIKVPDTGSFSADAKGAVAITVTIAVTLISLISYAIHYIVKRHSARVRF